MSQHKTCSAHSRSKAGYGPVTSFAPSTRVRPLEAIAVPMRFRTSEDLRNMPKPLFLQDKCFLCGLQLRPCLCPLSDAKDELYRNDSGIGYMVRPKGSTQGGSEGLRITLDRERSIGLAGICQATWMASCHSCFSSTSWTWGAWEHACIDQA